MKVIFKCSENTNEFQEEMEFDDDATDSIISEAFLDWMLAQVQDNYTWYKVEEGT